MKIKSFLGVAIFAFLLHGNTIAQQAVTSTGGNAGGVGGTVSYSVGQVAYINSAGVNGKVNQGVQQPYEFFVTGVRENKNIMLEMIVYPNPTHAIVNLRIENIQDIQGLIYLLYDVKGTLLLEKNIVDKVTEIPMTDLAAANYLLSVTNSKSEVLQIFKIIKH